jgi:hypothetical protein
MAETIVSTMKDVTRDLQAPIRDYYRTSEGSLSRAEAKINIGDKFVEAINDATDRAIRFQTGSPGIPIGVRDMVNDFKDEQEVYGRQFVSELDQLTEAQALARAALYARSILQLVSQVATDELPVLPVYPGDPELTCSFYCYCHLDVVRLGGGDFDVFWRLDDRVSDHCPDCPVLASYWNPLRIRNGRIQSGDLGLPAMTRMHAVHAQNYLKALGVMA